MVVCCCCCCLLYDLVVDESRSVFGVGCVLVVVCCLVLVVCCVLRCACSCRLLSGVWCVLRVSG